jgi:hypothetical protein
MSLVAPRPGKGTAEAPAAPRSGHGAQFWPRVPPNFFGIPFGLAGLAEAWSAASPTLGTPAAVADATDIVAAAAWLPLVAMYLARGPCSALADLRDPVLGPFVPVAAIAGMLLASALSAYSFGAGFSDGPADDRLVVSNAALALLRRPSATTVSVIQADPPRAAARFCRKQ